MADEALTCFTSLLESVPGWIAELETILKSASDRQHEFQAAEQPSTPSAVPRRRKSKSSSMNSRRSRDEQTEREGSLLRQKLRNLHNADALRISQRKRKTPSQVSGDHSGPSKFRVRMSGAIYYDGSVQKSFEQLVRGVGASRNTIRKGKMSAKVDALSRTGSSSSDGSSESEDFSPMTANLHFKSTRPARSRGIHTFARDDGTAAFDRVDSQLEKAQALCERAAHQILRDGDCTPEVTSAKDHFTQALQIAESEIPGLRRRAEKSAERQRRSEERRQADEEAEEKLRMSDTSLESDSKDIHIVPTFPSEGDLDVDELEVDDDDGEDEVHEFNLSAIPLGKIAPYRGMRMPARVHG